jgi:ferredoxin
VYYKNIIIGSGPAGISAASEILQNGKEVVILDVGNEIEDEKKNFAKSYLKTKNIRNFKEEVEQSKKKLPKYFDPNLKFPYGSDFVFNINKNEKISHDFNSNTLSSNAKGGLSNIWGTLSSPFFKKDIENWGISYDDFYREKNKVESIIPISSSKDNLGKFFDTEIGTDHTFDVSIASKEVLDFLSMKEDDLNNSGFFFGRSKFAVSNKYSFNKLNCQKCGLCHYGCPYECMFNAKNLLNILIEKFPNKLIYKQNLFVKNFKKKESTIYLNVIDTKTNESKQYSCENLFIGCGPILTASLVLRSKILQEKEIEIKESQRFYFPAFYLGKSDNNLKELKNTLPELFFEIYNKEISQKSIHLQFYTFNDLMLKPFEAFFGKFTKYLVKIFPFVFNRLTVIVGYIHSDYSSNIIIKDINENNESRYVISSKINKNSKNVINKCVKFLKKIFIKKFIIIPKLVALNLPGSSYHYGGSFPMSNSKQKETSTTLNGELYACKNVFILDASVFPDVPGSPTTFNIAINSTRMISNLINEERI